MLKIPKRFRRPARPDSDANESAPARVRALETHPDAVQIDPTRLDAETRAMYRDAREAAIDAQEDRERQKVRPFIVRSPFQLGFTITLGVLAALLFGSMVGQLSSIIMYVVGALFIALGLDPLVRILERKGVKRPVGIGVVFFGFILLIAGIVALIVPMIVSQVSQLVRSAPTLIRDVQLQNWFVDLQDRFGSFVDLEALLAFVQGLVTNPQNLAQVAGGVWQAGVGIASGVTAGLIVLILSLYFLASLSAMKRGFYSLIPRSGRTKVIDITEQVTDSVGGYVNGMAVIALINATLGFIMMAIMEVPFAGLVAVFAFFLAIIPLIGSVAVTVLVTVAGLFQSPLAAIVMLVFYLVYMQFEAYLLTPKIMNRVVSVPGSLVVIGALTGGTLLGLLGALIAIPVTAMILMIVKQVWIPRQETR